MSHTQSLTPLVCITLVSPVTPQDSIGVVAVDVSHSTLLETALQNHSVSHMMSSHDAIRLVGVVSVAMGTDWSIRIWLYR